MQFCLLLELPNCKSMDLGMIIHVGVGGGNP